MVNVAESSSRGNQGAGNSGRDRGRYELMRCGVLRLCPSQAFVLAL
jgi:hypothetical protein